MATKRGDFTQPRENLRPDGHRTVQEVNSIYEYGRTFPRGKNANTVYKSQPMPDPGQGDGMVHGALHKREVYLQKPQFIEDQPLPNANPDVALSDWRRAKNEDATTRPGYDHHMGVKHPKGTGVLAPSGVPEEFKGRSEAVQGGQFYNIDATGTHQGEYKRNHGVDVKLKSNSPFSAAAHTYGKDKR